MLVAVVSLWVLRSIAVVLVLGWKGGAAQIFFNCITEILTYMPAICTLNRLRSSLSGPISIGSSTITAHNFNFGMGRQPFSDTFRFSICKYIDDVMRI